MLPALLPLVPAARSPKRDDIGQAVGVLGESPAPLVAIDAVPETAAVQHRLDVVVMRASAGLGDDDGLVMRVGVPVG